MFATTVQADIYAEKQIKKILPSITTEGQAWMQFLIDWKSFELYSGEEHKMGLSDKLNPVSTGSTAQPPFNGFWGVTECIGCPAALLHRAAGCPVKAHSASTLTLFREGLMHEQMIKQQLEEKGCVVQEFRQPIYHPDLPVWGHLDCFVDGDLVEIKTIKNEEEIDEVLDNHTKFVPQVHGYMPLVSKTYARLLAKIRSSGWMLPDIIIEYDEEVASSIWKVVETAHNVIVSKGSNLRCPSEEPYLKCSDDYQTRLMCPYYDDHCTREPKMASEALNKMLWEYIGIDNLYHVYEAMRKNARSDVEEIIMTEGGFAGKFKSKDGVTVSKYPSSRKSIDWVAAMQLIPPDVLNKITVETRSEVMRITVPKHLKSAGLQSAGNESVD